MSSQEQQHQQRSNPAGNGGDGERQNDGNWSLVMSVLSAMYNLQKYSDFFLCSLGEGQVGHGLVRFGGWINRLIGFRSHAGVTRSPVYSSFWSVPTKCSPR